MRRCVCVDVCVWEQERACVCVCVCVCKSVRECKGCASGSHSKKSARPQIHHTKQLL